MSQIERIAVLSCALLGLMVFSSFFGCDVTVRRHSNRTHTMTLDIDVPELLAEALAHLDRYQAELIARGFTVVPETAFETLDHVVRLEGDAPGLGRVYVDILRHPVQVDGPELAIRVAASASDKTGDERFAEFCEEADAALEVEAR